MFEIFGGTAQSWATSEYEPKNSEDSHPRCAWDITIDDEHHGKDYVGVDETTGGLRSFSRCPQPLGLSDSDFNRGSHGLYESKGYEVGPINMRESLLKL